MKGERTGGRCGGESQFIPKETDQSETPYVVSHIIVVGLLFFVGGLASARAGEGTNLPAVADIKIDFARDIKPILDDSCIRCHGPEKPRSHFRLDSREAALKGGDNGVDIVPGNSAGSPLIRYVAGLDPDMLMPPADKGRPLTTNQIALLRAWIEQDVAWEATAPPPTNGAELSPFVGFTSVNGDNHKFREHYWQREGINGGVDSFEFWEMTGPTSKFTLSGRLLRDDYQLNFEQEKDDVGFIRSGWEQYRKYFDDTGGYHPADTPAISSLGQDLHLEIGRAWIDFGLTLPNWPRMVVGYEYQYRQGQEATLEWGNLNPTGVNINPAAQAVQENTQILKFDLDHEIAGTRIEDSFRAEFYHLNTSETNTFYSDDLGNSSASSSSEGFHYFQGANTFRLERKFNDWMFGSAGYLYSQMDAEASASGSTTAVPPPGFDSTWQTQGIDLQRESQVGNLNLLLGPWDGFSVSGGLQGEATHEQGMGQNFLNTTSGGAPVQATTAQLFSDLNTGLIEESAAVRYTKIPFTAIFAETRLRQERINQSQGQTGDASSQFDPEFALDTRFTSQLYDWRVGFNTSPWRWVSLSAHYRQYDDYSHYDNYNDQQPLGQPGLGYPGFILARDVLTDEIEGKVTLRPVNWFKTTLSYKQLHTDYHTDTDPAAFNANFIISDGGELLAGRSDLHIYSLNTTFTPWRRLFLSTTFSYQQSSTATAANDSPSVVPYQGDTFSALGNATYVLNQATDVLLTGSYSRSDYAQDNFAAGLPLGIRYTQYVIQAGLTRRITRNVIAKIQYSFFHYDEPTTLGVNDYNANTILGMVRVKLN
jgi:Planctomycete cytochrome C